MVILDWERQQAAERNPKIDCPTETISAKDAYNDVKAFFPYGLMKCFCDNLAKSEGTAASNKFTFELWDVPDNLDETKYCQKANLGA